MTSATGIGRRLGVALLALVAGAARAQESRPASSPTSRPSAGEWPEFRGGPRNLGVAPGPAPRWGGVKWRRPTASAVMSQPAVAGGRVYVATVENVAWCFDAATGDVVFERRVTGFEKSEDGLLKDHGFGFSAPLVIGGKVWIGNENGVLYALDAATGATLHERRLGERIWAAPKSNGRVVVASSVEGVVHGIDAATGEIRWRHDVGYLVGATPALLGNEAWIPCQGSRLLIVDLDTGKAETVKTSFSSTSTPALALGRLFLRSSRGEMTAFDLVTRDVRWAVKEPGDFHRSGPACDLDRVYFASPGGVRAYDPTTGEGLWSFPLDRRIESSPVVTGEHVVFGAADRTLYVLDRRTGALVKSFVLGEDLRGSVAVADGRAFVPGGTAGMLFAIE